MNGLNYEPRIHVNQVMAGRPGGRCEQEGSCYVFVNLLSTVCDDLTLVHGEIIAMEECTETDRS